MDNKAFTSLKIRMYCLIIDLLDKKNHSLLN